MSKLTKTFGITGVTLSGNMGGQAMLLTTLQELRQKCPQSKFVLFSIYPKADRDLNQYKDLQVLDSSPLKLLLIYFPIALLFWSISKVPGVRQLLSLIPFFKAVSECDWILDHCGIAFIDHRGLPLLAYNMACCLPAIVMGTPLIKLAQALGPFKTLLNRIASQLILSRCHQVIARGAITADFLKDLNLNNVKCLADTTFALSVSESVKQQAQKIWRDNNIPVKALVFSPSRVVERLCLQKGVDFKQEMLKAMAHLLEEGFAIVLLPHSLGTGKSKNNDVELCRELYQHLSQSRSNVYLLAQIPDAILLRALIAQSYLFIGCRFHSVVAALATATPCIVIGWSHKYKEMAAPFGMEHWVDDLSNFTSEGLIDKIKELETQRIEVKQNIERASTTVNQLALENYNLI